MAFKITQADAKRLVDAAQGLRTGRGKVEDAVRKYNEALGPAHARLEESVAAYNEKLGAVRKVLEDIQSGAQTEFAKKSEKWQVSDRGEAVQTWIEGIESVIDDLDEVSLDEPTELDVDDMLAGDDLAEKIGPHDGAIMTVPPTFN